MEFQLIHGNHQNQPADCIILGLFSEKEAQSALNNNPFKEKINTLLDNGDLKSNLGSCALVLGPPHLIIVGLGEKATFNESAYLKALNKSIEKIPDNTEHLICTLTELDVKDIHWRLRQAAKKIFNHTYRFVELKTDPDPLPRLEKVECSGGQSEDNQQALAEGLAIGKGMALSRDLGNLPGNICTPTYLAQQAEALGKKFKTMGIEILDAKQMKKLNMNTLLSVSQGSVEPPKLIIMSYKNAPDESTPPYVLVGKGITFDSGGISLKPPSSMDEMKFDMCGAATVFGTMQSIAELNLPINVIGVVAASENLPGPAATKPGDIVKTMLGKTVEILNTDAEGRLVLCDALTYIERFKPKAVIDIATLTGAIVIALGDVAAGIMGNHQDLVDQLVRAGDSSGDKLWQLPLFEEYEDKLKSQFADLPNISSDRQAGSITAGSFLSHFTKQYDWAHIDIAGVAWHSGKNKGASGRPVPAIMEFLLSQSEC